MKQAIEITAYVLVGIAVFAFLMGVFADFLKHHKANSPVVRDEIIKRASMMPLSSWEIVCYVEMIDFATKEVIVESKVDDIEVIALGKTFNGKLSTVFEIELKRKS